MKTECWLLLLTVLAVTTLRVEGSSLFAVRREGTPTICPDNGQCPEGSTCCTGSNGRYSCCSYKNAVCCDDGEHCCPENSFCQDGGCVMKQSEQTAAEKLISSVGKGTEEKKTLPLESNPSAATCDKSANSEIVICPDPTRFCPDYNTCCLMPNHQWVCCPLPQAACCPDGYHCCPYGSRCDATSTRCYRGNGEEDSSTLFFLHSILSARKTNKQQQLLR